MASFQNQVESLVGGGYSITGNIVKLGYLTQHLFDGVMDVTTRTIALNPSESFKFQRTSAVQTNQGFNPAGGTVLGVMRESGSSTDYRVCRQIPLEQESRVTDINSIYYASKFNPAFAIQEDGKINVYPAPADSAGEKYKVNYKVGYDSISDIPDPIIQAIKIMVSDMYENRQSVIVGKIVSEIPKTAEYLMQPYKIQTL